MARVQSAQGSEPSLPSHGQPLMGEADQGINADGARRQLRERDAVEWIYGFALLFLLCNSAAAIYRARDLWDVGFVTGVSATFFCLLGSLSAYDRTPQEDHASRRRRRGLKVAIWALATTLNFAFSFRVAAMMPTAILPAIWGLAALVTFAGLWLLIFEGCDDTNA